jgi:hypothetical protein
MTSLLYGYYKEQIHTDTKNKHYKLLLKRINVNRTNPRTANSPSSKFRAVGSPKIPG